MAPPPVARKKIEAAGIDWCLEQLEAGRSFRNIAVELGVNQMTLHAYLRDNPIRSAQTDAALIAGAESYEQQAMDILRETYEKLDSGEPHPNGGALASVARERAQACWRSASVRDPRRFNASRGGDTYIDARKAVQSVTIIGVPPRGDGGVHRIAATGGSHEVGVLPSSGSEIENAVFPARAEKSVSDLLVSTSKYRRKVVDE
jgi:hypothetical protein